MKLSFISFSTFHLSGNAFNRQLKPAPAHLDPYQAIALCCLMESKV